MKISSLAVVSIASVIILSGWLVSGEAQADAHNEQTISGDSGSTDAVATPASSDAGAKAGKKNKKKKKPKMVCKRERVTGTHIRQRVCRSQAQIDAEREDTQRAVRGTSAAGALN